MAAIKLSQVLITIIAYWFNLKSVYQVNVSFHLMGGMPEICKMIVGNIQFMWRIAWIKI